MQALSKSFGKQRVLKGINLEVAQGETLSVLGRSGTGKSVLLKLIIGLHKPDSGSIRVHGQEVSGLAAEGVERAPKKGWLLVSTGSAIRLADGRRKRRLSLEPTFRNAPMGKASACVNS